MSKSNKTKKIEIEKDIHMRIAKSVALRHGITIKESLEELDKSIL